MHNRSSTPDILGSLMTGAQSVKQKKEEAPPIKITDDEVKEKATFNLPVILLGELEDVCHEIRKMCKSKQVSKTLIVEQALKKAFSDFHNKKQASELFRALEKSLKDG